MNKQNSLARRLAPGLMLGTAAVTLVGLMDPAIGDMLSDGQQGKGLGKSAQGAGQSPAQNAATAQSSSNCSSGSELQGQVVNTKYGPVQVAAKVAGGKVCSARALAYPTRDRESAQISRAAIPMLNRAAVSAGVQFDAISDATYTSEGYRQSLQSVLDSM